MDGRSALDELSVQTLYVQLCCIVTSAQCVSAGWLVEIFWKNNQSNSQNFGKVEMWECFFHNTHLLSREAAWASASAKEMIFVYGGGLCFVCKDFVETVREVSGNLVIS